MGAELKEFPLSPLLSRLLMLVPFMGCLVVADSFASDRVGRAQECRLVVGEKEFISGDCPAIIHERGGITVGSNGAGGEMMPFWAYVYSENGSTGTAFYNGSSGNKYAQVDLGPAESHGWCWLAPDAEICLKGFTELDLGQEDLASVDTVSSSESPLECGLIDKATIECSVHVDSARVTDVVLNRGRCATPIPSEVQKSRIKKWLASLNERESNLLAISPEFLIFGLRAQGKVDIADALILVANDPIKSYGFGDKFKIANTCENLLEFTITVNQSEWTWEIGR